MTETELTDTQQNDWELLRKRILVLNEKAWDGRLSWPVVKKWLENFNGAAGIEASTERLHALYLLSQMMYFGGREIRVLLRALYSELIFIPIIQKIRNKYENTRDTTRIKIEAEKELGMTRFLGVGNPSESGVHLLYYFRQENRIPKDHFLYAATIFSRKNVDGIINSV